MSNYRAIVHFHFKKGMEEQGMRFLENELLKKGQHYGCHKLELWQDERDHSKLLGIAEWNSLEEARHFQQTWQSKERELARLCLNPPHHEFFKLRSAFGEKARRAA